MQSTLKLLEEYQAQYIYRRLTSIEVSELDSLLVETVHAVFIIWFIF